MIYMFKVTHYYLQIYFKILEINVLKYMSLILRIFYLHLDFLSAQACLKKTGVQLELLTNNDILMMIGKGTRGEICPAIHRYAKENNK